MTAVFLLVGLAMLELPGLAAATGRRLRPSEWARVNRAAIRFGYRAIQLGLVLTAAPTVFGLAGIPAIAHACHRALGPIMSGGTIAGLVSMLASLALFVVARVVSRRVARLRRVARVDDWWGEHRHLRDDVSVVLLPTDAVVAYATPGSPSQVVVSRGIARALNPEELESVVRHELVHLRHRHDRYVRLAAIVDANLGWLPGVRASTGALRLSVERWADEEAAELPGTRAHVRGALLKTTESLLSPVPAFGSAGTLVARLNALDGPPPAPTLGQRVAALGPFAGLLAVTATGFLWWSIDHGLGGILGFCLR